MRLGPGKFFGEPVWERRCNGLLLTLSVYPPCRTQPWHCHANPTFFLLLGGDHRDRSGHADFEQPAFSFVYHPTTKPHAGELGPSGMRGLNIEYEREWLAKHSLSEADLGDYRPVASALARQAALHFITTAFQPGRPAENDLETQGLELLEPLVAPTAGSGVTPTPPRLKKAVDLLQARFRESVSLRDAAREAELHPVHLARMFRRFHHCSISEWLRALRLAEAGRLVLEGLPLAEAASAAGFADQAHFSRCFRLAFGCPPKRGLWPARLSLQR